MQNWMDGGHIGVLDWDGRGDNGLPSTTGTDGWTSSLEKYMSDHGHQSYLHQAYSALEIVITPKEIKAMNDLVIRWELRDTHVEALGGPLLGVYPMGFSDADRTAFFQIFHQDEKHLRALVKTWPTFNVMHKVSSDPFAHLAFWVIHLAPLYIQNQKLCQTFQLDVAKYLHYRWFASVVNHYFPHRASEEIMQATINSLSRRFEIVELETWQRVLEARCVDLLGPKSIHYHRIRTMNDDGEIIKMLNDSQIRVKERVQNVSNVYYAAVANPNQRVISQAAVKEIDGEKVLIQGSSVFDVMTSSLATEILSVPSFVDTATVKAVSKMFPAISSPEMLKQLLIGISDRASSQVQSGTLDKVVRKDGEILYVGIRALVEKIIQSSFRYCLKKRVPLNNRAVVLLRIKEAFASSRIADPEILAAKAGVVNLVDGLVKTNREATKSSLRLAFIVYLVLRGFNYL